MRSWSVIIILAVSQFVMVLDSTVMNVSISVVADDLGTSITGMQAAITFYALTMAAFMLTGGKLGDLMGRARAFKIGAVIYGIGSLTTALSPNLTVLLIGWSLVEGLGAVLVIPAIASLAAINYTGKARVTAFSILGAVTGLAAAVGPLLGGVMTTYLSWRYVFVAETVVMVAVLFAAKLIRDVPRDPEVRIDPLSVVASAGGLSLIVYGVLQSKTWGWLKPQHPPEIGGDEIAPLGVSPVAYLLLAGVVVLWLFVLRQRTLAKSGRQPLLRVELFRIAALRSGLGGFLAQYFAIAALFFVVPVYLQTMLGRDALQTGVKILPLSVGLVLFSILGSWLTARRSARFIARGGQITMALGTLLVIASVGIDLRNAAFAAGMFVVGAGFGLLASQLGNVNMSAVEEKDTSEVGGLQGTFQNLGSSFGTAVAGSVFLLMLSSGFVSAVDDAENLSPTDQQRIIAAVDEQGVPIISADEARTLVLDAGGSEESAQAVSQAYSDSQIAALQQSLFVVFGLLVLALLFSRHLPNRIPEPGPALERQSAEPEPESGS
ncbi:MULTISPECIES: MFS transporter [unclassified Gordonia (in: high G+C Gram-positive bacteria)]|uniref:MFS transporter n=1 Tax=unclassified Gordonia (in: high G+C Gram-positive bacteria) TaxID=2657482 RepID=UPI00071E29F7|nr:MULTISPECIES: MFS transporter [unclassified Gordonia (in: high G+C Gram-positive bacteria)]KSU58521.1 MFS transporter [Gordonia sp. SGD-V-85]SCC22120.1 Major Facilitator Superfamily protein [Gordonia sp. v-85]